VSLHRLDRLLLERLADGQFHSGAALADHLEVTRTAVWKHVRALDRLGLDVASVPGRGYRLLSPVELLSADLIQAGLSPEAARLLARLDIHERLDSTNSHLLQAAGAGALPGSVCLAEHQLAGRGRLGRTWVSPFGANIYLSLLWRFESPARLSGLSLAVGVAALRAFRALGIEDANLKWPNDILWQEAKLGGILLEVAGESHGPCVVVAGLGLNRYLPDAAASQIDQAHTDLTRMTGGRSPSRHALISALLNALLPVFRDFPDTGLTPYLPEWRAAHAHAGQEGQLRMGDTVIEGRIVDITDEGYLVLQEPSGGTRAFASGDVSLRVKTS
jgi:BirA family biotin operon repressor/biotin-[acetyl-CoA-carboxylase] ligase